jgi:hypothetical protein
MFNADKVLLEELGAEFKEFGESKGSNVASEFGNDRSRGAIHFQVLFSQTHSTKFPSRMPQSDRRGN